MCAESRSVTQHRYYMKNRKVLIEKTIKRRTKKPKKERREYYEIQRTKRKKKFLDALEGRYVMNWLGGDKNEK